MTGPEMDPEQVGWINEHLGLAQSIALRVWRKAPHALDLDDLRAIAYLGLTQAAWRWRTYCREKGYQPEAMQYFRPFVVKRVNGALMDAIRASDWATRSLRTKAKLLQEAGAERGATQAQLAERTGMSVAEVRATVRGMAQRPVSLDAEDLDPGADTDVESSAFTADVLAAVVDRVRDLDPDQRTVLALHYFGGKQLQEVARTMGITESRASQLHAAAVLSVHEAMLAAAEQQCDR